MVSPIRKLSESLILKIAAGEVVERPASVVKELVENSIDAGARRIEVRVTGGGLQSISVTDDGCGIPAEEVPLSLERHATSKIETDEDLTRIQTLGFRGEALPAIAAVSHLDLLTRTEDSESGTRLSSEGGAIRTLEPCGTLPGTTVTVSHLFFNTPARKKFMRSKTTEFGHTERAMRRIALARLDLALLLEHEGKIIFQVPRTKTLIERISQLYGKEISSHIQTVHGNDGTVAVDGAISSPNLTFGRATELWFFVNGRPIQDRMLQAAVMEGYRTLLMERRYPLGVVRLQIPPHRVDVNVHPTKAEVRFADPQAIFRLVSQSISTLFAKSTFSRPRSGAEPVQRSFHLGEHPGLAVLRTAAVPYVAGEEAPAAGFFSSLEFLSVLDQTYLLLRSADALYVIDQHAAHERVHFEKLRKAFERETPQSQKLLLPITMELSAEREGALAALTPVLLKLGFELETFGPRTRMVRSVPASLRSSDPRMLLTDLADGFLENENHAALKDRTDGIVSRLACHAAVRAHDPLSPQEIETLLAEMDRVDLSSHCPHGRPAFLKFSVGDFERLFHRK